jgi:hypothetical protein
MSIITLNQKYDKVEGRGLPMFSRVGQGTIQSYLVFQKPNQRERPVVIGGGDAGSSTLVDGAEDIDECILDGDSNGLDVHSRIKREMDKVYNKEPTVKS